MKKRVDIYMQHGKNPLKSLVALSLATLNFQQNTYVPPTQSRLTVNIAAIQSPICMDGVRRDLSHLWTAFCGNPNTSTMVLPPCQPESQRSLCTLLSRTLFSLPQTVWNAEKPELKPVKRKPLYSATWLELNNSRPSVARLPSQRMGCMPSSLQTAT